MAAVVAGVIILPFQPSFAAILAIGVVPLMAYPYWRDVRTFRSWWAGVSRPLLIFAVLAGAALVVTAAIAFPRQIGGTDEAARGGWWLDYAEHATVLALAGLLAVSRGPGWRILRDSVRCRLAVSGTGRRAGAAASPRVVASRRRGGCASGWRRVRHHHLAGIRTGSDWLSTPCLALEPLCAKLCSAVAAERCVRRAATAIVVDDAVTVALAFARGRHHRRRCCERECVAPCRSVCRHFGRAVLPGLGRIEHLGQPGLPSRAWLGVRGREQVPWPGSLARGPYGWVQVATFVITGLLILVLAAVRDDLPRRRASAIAVGLLALLGVALILAAFRVHVPMLSGGSPATWHGWVHGVAFLLIIATGVLAPLVMALAVRGNAGWRLIGVISVAASALFVVFLLLP